MTRPQEPPLDERVHQHPGMNQWYMGGSPDSQFRFRFMDENMLHRYFAESPFFDWTSKNGLEISHSKTDPWAWQTTHNRKAFEDYLATRNGLEFMVIEGGNVEFDGEGNWKSGGVWVMRKQDRVKDGAGGKDEVRTLGTYFFIGENTYQAPSVGDVVGMRLLTAATALGNLFSEARTLPTWSPTTGHTYLPPTSSTTKAAGTSTAATSVANSPRNSRSRSASVARAGSVEPTASTTSTAASESAKSTNLLLTSLRQSFAYPSDYIDENPLLGEPGSLTFTSSTTAVKKRKADAEAAVQAAQLAKEMKQAKSRSATPAVMTSKPPAGAGGPPAVMSDATSAGKLRKEERKGSKVKRRKSRMVGGTPAASPLGGAGGGGSG